MPCSSVRGSWLWLESCGFLRWSGKGPTERQWFSVLQRKYHGQKRFGRLWRTATVSTFYLPWANVSCTFILNAWLCLTSALLNTVTIQAIKKTLSSVVEYFEDSAAESCCIRSWCRFTGHYSITCLLGHDNSTRRGSHRLLDQIRFVITMGVFISASFFGIVVITLDRFVSDSASFTTRQSCYLRASCYCSRPCLGF